jgi:hypothetical protein
MKSYFTKFLVFLLFLAFIVSTPLRAQTSGATLTGTITDPQGDVVPNAKVSARNIATNVTTDTETNSSGLFNIVNLNPGDYQVSITATGFATSTSKVSLFVGKTQELSLALTVGQVSQTVEVTGAAPTVETTNATLSGDVEGQQIVELPLNGRDWVSLATLTPGVESIRPHELVTQPGGSTRGLGVQMSVNGARPQQNVYTLNGIVVNDYSNAGPGNVLGANAGVDAIQEFSVLTTNYSAQYGFTSGGVINAVTKSGTNTLHGSVYEFMRNSYLDAADRFEDPTPQNCLTASACGFPKGNFVRNQFGASGGWKVFKDKFFLFGNYEGFRQEQALIQSGTVLTAAGRLGIINGSNGLPLNPLPAGAPCPYAKNDPNGMTNEAPGLAAICVDNFTFAEVNPCGAVSGPGSGLPGGTPAPITPCTSGAPPGVLSPLPNGAFPLNDANDNAFYNSDLGEGTSDNYATVRGDYKISDKDSLSGSWYRDTSTWVKPGTYTGAFASSSGYQVPHGAYTLDETHIFNTTLVNDFRLGLDLSDLFSPSFSNANPISHATSLCVVPNGGSGTTCTSVPIGILPNWGAGGGSIGGNGNSGNAISVTGPGGGFTGAPGFQARTKKIEAFDDISKTMGNHNLKFGFEMIDDHEDWIDGPAGQAGGGPSYGGLSQGTYFPSFCAPTATNECNGGVPINCTVNTPNPLPLSCGGGTAAFLMDISHTVRMPVEQPFIAPATYHHYRSQVYGAYFEDDWKMKSNLTINMGIRYEMSTIPYETDDKIDNLKTIYQNIGPGNPGYTSCTANALGIAVCPGFENKTFQTNPTLANFEPRLGFAWDPFHDGKTSIRGGAGIFDVLPMSYMFALNSMQTAPNGEIDLTYGEATPNGTGGTCVGATNCLTALGIGQPAGWGRFPTFEAADATGTSAAAERYGYIEPNPKRSYVAQYNLNIQRQITPTLTIMVAYAGSQSWHDPWQMDDLNTVDPYAVLVPGGGTRYIFPNPVGSGCLPGPPNCSQTDAFLNVPVNYVNAAVNQGTTAMPSFPCINGTPNTNTSCVSANNGITPGLLINSNVVQEQSSIFQAQSWYNALQVRVTQNLNHGLFVGGSFTWGKSYDTSSSSFASDNYSNNPSAIWPYWDQHISKGLSDYNVTKQLSINGLYTIPTRESWKNGIMGGVVGGWGIGWNFLMSDGIPLWPLGTNNDPGMLNGGPYNILDLVPGCNQVLPNSRSTMNYNNPACYTLPQVPAGFGPVGSASSMAFYNGSGTPGLPGYNPGCDKSVAYPNCINLLGDDPRNFVIGPGIINLDFSVTKDTYIKRISETADLQFRAEFFNILNRTNYGFPPAGPGNLSPLANNITNTPNPTFGIMTSTQSPNREIQFALKLIF